MKKLLLALFLLFVVAGVLADDLYAITIKDGEVQSTQSLTGYAPQRFDGGTYKIKGTDGNVLGEGRFAYPTSVAMEKFNKDNSIDGELVAYEGTITVIAPAFDGAATVDLLDPAGKLIATVPVPEDTDLAAVQGGDFFLRYTWVFILIFILIIIAAVIVGIVIGVKKLRKKKH